ncbi:MAG: hypothetical protein OFPI_36570 [Osedax symbiont Rs2]|nr:MAG: hypothetical protein OFPI_36570 [Osedax symbiont Rs2]
MIILYFQPRTLSVALKTLFSCCLLNDNCKKCFYKNCKIEKSNQELLW